VILQSFDGYHWIYWVGPCLGSLLAVVFYRFIKILEYETANPGQDSDGNLGRIGVGQDELTESQKDGRLHSRVQESPSDGGNGQEEFV
jgi:hypothetical protein